MAYVAMLGAKLYKKGIAIPWTVNLMKNKETGDMLTMVGSPDLDKKTTVFKDSNEAEFDEVVQTMINAVDPFRVRRWRENDAGEVEYMED